MLDRQDNLFEPSASAPSGRSRSGQARMAKLTSEQRSQLGKSAAQKRWSGPSAVQSMTDVKDIVLFDGDVVLPCAVLSGEVRVLTQNGFLRAVGRTGRPNRKAIEGDQKMPPML